MRMPQGFLYLVAVLDWYSRYVLSWQLSNTLDTRFCLDALDQALCVGQPQIFNTGLHQPVYTSRPTPAGWCRPAGVGRHSDQLGWTRPSPG